MLPTLETRFDAFYLFYYCESPQVTCAGSVTHAGPNVKQRSAGAPFLNSSRGPQAESAKSSGDIFRAPPSRKRQFWRDLGGPVWLPGRPDPRGPRRRGEQDAARTTADPEILGGGGKGRREAGYYGMWGSRGRRAPYPPVTVQSLNSPVVRVFVQSHSHSPGHRFP